MTRSDLVFIANRTIAVFLFIPLLLELPTLPALIYTEHVGKALPNFVDVWTLRAIFAPLVDLLLAILFWRCGPLVQRLFADRRKPLEFESNRA